MTVRILPIAVALTRTWLRVYTRHMPPHLADARRAEIESDLWEMQHDPDLACEPRSGSMALRRLIDGIRCDIAWRVDNAAFEEQFIVRRLFAMTAATVLVLSLWTAPALFARSERDVAACAAVSQMPQIRADLLDEVVRCAGALFSSPACCSGSRR